jgi:tetratricopeptide (TPR) repeat protein
MSKNMDPSMIAQAQAMMSNPAMAQQAQQAVANLSAEEIQSRMGSLGSAPALPAKPASVVAQLRASAMSIPDDVLELIEEAEGFKLEGNNKFKAGEFEAAASRYRQGCRLIDSVLGNKALSGGDKKAVIELLDACQLNTANCKLKLEDWDGAKQMAEVVLGRGENRKALFRRGQAYQNMGRLHEARADLIKAAAMDPQDRRGAIISSTWYKESTLPACLAN